MTCCKLLLKVGFLAFFILNAWNIRQNLDQHVATFKTDYKTFEHTITTRTGLTLPPQLHHDYIWKHSETIVKFFGWSQFILSAAAILISGGFTSVVSFVYFIQQAIHLNFAGYSAQSSFADFEKLALQLSILFAGITICLCTKSACRSASACTRKSQVSDIRGSQASDKKRN